jgi:hypothetical protein
MYDRPSADELLEAAQQHLEHNIIPVVKSDRALYFQTLVALNVLRIVQREGQLAEDHLREEWAALNTLLNLDSPFPEPASATRDAIAERRKTLCELIRRGDFDDADAEQQLHDYMLRHATAQLSVANPRFLQQLAEEDAATQTPLGDEG